MKKALTAIIILLLSRTIAYSQASFNTMDSIDVNNITANMLVHGDMMWNPMDYSVSGCQYPAHSGKIANFTTAVWISGYDAGSNLHIAAQTYRQTGNDFWPGPLNSGDTLTYASSYAWAKIWKVNQTDIQYFLSQSTHTITNTPQAILTWPGKGNTQAQGNTGIALTIDHDMAPFVDLNGNGIYEPLLGEYPDIKGDQALWWVFSDNGPAHAQTHGRALGVEVHAMAYGYHRNTLIDNVFYLDYTLVNRSGNDYHNTRMALWDDVEIGWYLDDYIGFDSTRRLGFAYNASNDDGGSAGHPINGYGLNPPACGLTMIVLPGDTLTNYVAAGSFGYFNNDASSMGNPTVDTEYNNYMRSKFASGQHFVHDTSALHPFSGPDCNYMFTGDPGDHSQWSECSLNDVSGDRRSVLASNDFSLPAGGKQHILLAFVVADSFGGCGHTQYDRLMAVTDTAWGNYFNPPLPSAAATVNTSDQFSIYPNPAYDKLTIETGNTSVIDEHIAIYNSIGQLMNASIDHSGSKIIADLSHLPTGMYCLRYTSNTMEKSMLFTKQ